MPLALFLFAVPGLASEMLGQPPSDDPDAIHAHRNFFKAALFDAGDALAAPLAWKPREWGALALPSAALLVLIRTDAQSYPRLRGRQDWLESSMPVATQFGEGLYAAGGTALLWGAGEIFGKDGLADASSTALESMAFCAVASGTLKYAFSANRPSDWDSSHDFFTGGIQGSPSFPSGHSLVAFSLAESYGASYGRWWTYPLACVVGYSRIYLGAHWLSDVAAGAVLGAALGHMAVLAREEKGAPRSLSFAFAPGESGGAMAMARVSY